MAFALTPKGQKEIVGIVVLLEKVSLGEWVRNQPVALDIVLRTFLYTIGVWIALLLEKAFEARHEHGGFGPSLLAIFEHRDIHHVWASTIGVCAALLVFITFFVLKRHYGFRCTT